MPRLLADRQRDGAVAEDAACALLESLGLRLLDRNARYPFGELDLVMRDGDTLAFIEVRLRQDPRFGGAAVSIDAGKRRKLALAAQAWLSTHRDHSRLPCRFDVVAVVRGANGLECDWIPSAFTLDDV